MQLNSHDRNKKLRALFGFGECKNDSTSLHSILVQHNCLGRIQLHEVVSTFFTIEFIAEIQKHRNYALKVWNMKRLPNPRICCVWYCRLHTYLLSFFMNLSQATTCVIGSSGIYYISLARARLVVIQKEFQYTTYYLHTEDNKKASLCRSTISIVFQLMSTIRVFRRSRGQNNSTKEISKCGTIHTEQNLTVCYDWL